VRALFDADDLAGQFALALRRHVHQRRAWRSPSSPPASRASSD
jgi:hypothetical protein